MNRCCRRIGGLAALVLLMALAGFGPFGLNVHADALARKPVPRITFKNLSPPYTDYDYFQDCRQVPFECEAASFSLVNAWWLAESSTLVYADEEFVRQQFGRAGFDHVRFFDRAGTQCFVAANHRFAIVAFRGSEIWKRGDPFDARRIIADLATDFDVRLSPWKPGERVHSGFKSALDEVWSELRTEIDALQADGIRIWLTGHSLGAALATLAADRLADVQGVYTFGSPRVGDATFRARFEPLVYRVVNGRDFVTGVPPRGRYRHVGILVPIAPHEGSDGGPPPAKDARPPCPAGDDACAHDRDRAVFDSAALIPRPIRDHVPLLYAIHLWNALVERSLAAAIPR